MCARDALLVTMWPRSRQNTPIGSDHLSHTILSVHLSHMMRGECEGTNTKGTKRSTVGAVRMRAGAWERGTGQGWGRQEGGAREGRGGGDLAAKVSF
jgi:hypothetical protein